MGYAIVVDSDELKAIHTEMVQVKQMLDLLLSKPQQITTADEGLLSIPKAAKRAGIGIKVMKKAIRDGIITPTKIHNGGQLRIPPEEVERYKNAVSKGEIPTRMGRKPKYQT